MITFVGRYAIPNSLHPTGEDGSGVRRSRRYTYGVFAVRELSLATDKDEFIFSDRATATNSARCRGIVAWEATCEPLGRAVNQNRKLLRRMLAWGTRERLLNATPFNVAGEKSSTPNRSLPFLVFIWLGAEGGIRTSTLLRAPAPQAKSVMRTPFRRGTQALIKFERQNNRRFRRVTSEEEPRLLAAGNSLVHMLIVAALDTGMRRAELLALRFGDIDWDRQLIHIRPEIAKSKKGRVVPIGTTRLRRLLEWLRVGPNNETVPDDRLVFLRRDGETVKSFRTAWERARTKAGLSTVRFHDLRSEYASRLVECGVPLSQVRDLLGHCSIVVTERYDRVRLDSLKAAVARLDERQPFKILSTSPDQAHLVESLSSSH